MIFIDRVEGQKKIDKIFLWGTGKLAKWIHARFEDEIKEMNISGFLDNDKNNEGKTFFDYKIYQPYVLEKCENCHVIILTENTSEIVTQIEKYYFENVVRCESFHYFIRFRLLARYQFSSDPEIQEIMNYILKNSLTVFNYSFIKKYDSETYDIFYDEKKQMFYTFYEKNKMFFPRRYDNRKAIESYIRQIRKEQDKLSPHCYLTDEFSVNDNDIVLDAGVAEGNFALSVIEKVKRIYLVEPDIEWVEALRYTFEPYMDKVVIINKYLSNYNSKETITIDSIVEERLNFIKMDIEGEEYYALQGAGDVIKANKNIKCTLCTYHQEFDFINIENLLNELGFTTQPSKGYMWFPFDKDYFYSLPTLRRGLIRGVMKE